MYEYQGVRKVVPNKSFSDTEKLLRNNNPALSIALPVAAIEFDETEGRLWNTPIHLDTRT